MNWELEFKRCLEKRWLVAMPEARYLVEKELRAAGDDLGEAEASYQRGGYKWSTIRPIMRCSMPLERCCTAGVTVRRAIIVLLSPCAIFSSVAA